MKKEWIIPKIFALNASNDILSGPVRKTVEGGGLAGFLTSTGFFKGNATKCGQATIIYSASGSFSTSLIVNTPPGAGIFMTPLTGVFATTAACS